MINLILIISFCFSSIIRANDENVLDNIFLNFTSYENLEDEIIRSKLNFDQHQFEKLLFDNGTEEFWSCSDLNYSYLENPPEESNLSIQVYKDRIGDFKSLETTIILKYSNLESSVGAYEKIISDFKKLNKKMTNKIEDENGIMHFNTTEIKLDRNKIVHITHLKTELPDLPFRQSILLIYSYTK